MLPENWPKWKKTAVLSGLVSGGVALLVPVVQWFLSNVGLSFSWLDKFSYFVKKFITYRIDIWKGLICFAILIGFVFARRRYGWFHFSTVDDTPPFTTEELQEIKSRVEAEPDWKNYTSADIEGVNWTWEWEDTTPTNLEPFCPECKMEISLNALRESVDPSIDPISKPRTDPVTGGHLPRFVTKGTETECEKCGFTNEWDNKEDKLRKYVKKEIRRRKRTGEYDT